MDGALQAGHPVLVAGARAVLALALTLEHSEPLLLELALGLEPLGFLLLAPRGGFALALLVGGTLGGRVALGLAALRLEGRQALLVAFALCLEPLGLFL